MEEWKEIDKYPGLIISDLGNVKNWRGRALHPHKKKGWNYIQWLDPVRDKLRVAPIHIMVAECFLDNPHGYKWVRHRNGNRQDNRASNLAWTMHRNDRPEVPKKEHKAQVEYDRTALGDLKILDSNGAIALFNAICEKAIDDLYKVHKAREEDDVTTGDMLDAEDARDFFERTIYMYGLDLDKQAVMKAVARKIQERMNSEKQTEAEEDELPKWKKRCERCKYRTVFPDATADPRERRQRLIACGYILATGHRRPCRGANCTVYKKGEQLKLKTGFSPIYTSRVMKEMKEI